MEGAELFCILLVHSFQRQKKVVLRCHSVYREQEVKVEIKKNLSAPHQCCACQHAHFAEKH